MRYFSNNNCLYNSSVLSSSLSTANSFHSSTHSKIEKEYVQFMYMFSLITNLSSTEKNCHDCKDSKALAMEISFPRIKLIYICASKIEY